MTPLQGRIVLMVLKAFNLWEMANLSRLRGVPPEAPVLRFVPKTYWL